MLNKLAIPDFPTAFRTCFHCAHTTSSYGRIEDSAVIDIALLGQHVDPEEGDLGVLSEAGALGLAVVAGVEHAAEVVLRLHLGAGERDYERGRMGHEESSALKP